MLMSKDRMFTNKDRMLTSKDGMLMSKDRECSRVKSSIHRHEHMTYHGYVCPDICQGKIACSLYFAMPAVMDR